MLVDTHIMFSFMPCKGGVSITHSFYSGRQREQFPISTETMFLSLNFPNMAYWWWWLKNFFVLKYVWISKEQSQINERGDEIYIYIYIFIQFYICYDGFHLSKQQGWLWLQYIFHCLVSTLHASLHRVDFDVRYACSVLSPFYFGFPLKYIQKDSKMMCAVQKLQEQMKSSAFLLMAVTERWWAGHGCRPSVMAGNWSLENRHVFLSSLRELCLLLAFTVCHAAERHGYHFFPSCPSRHISLSHTRHLKEETCHPPLHT